MEKWKLLKDLPRMKAGDVCERIAGDEYHFKKSPSYWEVEEIPESTRSEWLEEVDERWQSKVLEEFFFLEGSCFLALRSVVLSAEHEEDVEHLRDIYNLFKTRKQAEECERLCFETRKKYTESLNK